VWLTAIAAISAVFVAVRTISTSRKTAQRTAAINYLITTEQDRQWDEGYEVIKAAKSNGTDLRKLAEKVAPDDENAEKKLHDSASVDAVLNILEIMAVGVREGIFCEKTLKRSIWKIVVRTYDVTEPYIKAIRATKDAPTNFQEIEGLAKRWKKFPLEENKNNEWINEHEFQ